MSTLRAERVTAGYGQMDVLRDISIVVQPGELVATLGRNGAGKTTLLRTICGLERARGGQVCLGSSVISSRRAWQTARLGVTLVLDGARVFGGQTVAENIAAGREYARDQTRSERYMDTLVEIFPILREKSDVKGASLSGGERMQLAIAQAVAAAPRFLLLDEPSVGLSPGLVRAVFDALDKLRRIGENDDAMGILVAEQMVGPVLRVADRAVVLDQGAVVVSGTAAELRENPAVMDAYLGAAAGESDADAAQIPAPPPHNRH